MHSRTRTFARRLTHVAALACWLTFTNAATAQTAAITLAEAMQKAANNADVSLARRAAAAASADVTSADHAPAPVVTAKAASIDLQNGIGGGNLLRDKRIDKSLGVDWTWERGDKRALRTRAAQRTADAAQADVQETVVLQQIAASNAFYDLLAAQERVTQVEGVGRSAQELAGNASRRVKAGDLSQQEALRIEIESQRAGADTRVAREDRRRAEQALALLTGMPTPLQARADWPAANAQDTPLPDLPIDSRADVQAAQQRLRAAQAALDNAQALRKTDLTLGTSLDHFPGTSTRQLEVRVQVPLSGLFGTYGYDGEIAKARAQLDQAQDQLDKTRRQAASDSQRLQQDLQAGAARATSYAGAIVPRARQVAAMAELAYSKGAMSLTDLIDARRTLRTVLLEDIAARAEHARLLTASQLRSANGSATGSANAPAAAAASTTP